MSPWIWYHNTSCVNQFPKWHGTTLFLKKQTAPQASFCHLTGHCLNDSFCLGPCTLESLLFGLYAGCSGCVSTNKKPIQTPDCFTACEKRRGMEESNFSTLHINCTIAQGLKQLQSISNLLDHWSAEAAVQILWGTNQTENPVSGRKKSFASTTCKERASASKAKRPRYPQSQAKTAEGSSRTPWSAGKRFNDLGCPNHFCNGDHTFSGGVNAVVAVGLWCPGGANLSISRGIPRDYALTLFPADVFGHNITQSIFWVRSLWVFLGCQWPAENGKQLDGLGRLAASF